MEFISKTVQHLFKLLSLQTPCKDDDKRLSHLRPYQNELEQENAMVAALPSLRDFSGHCEL